ncbi:hypothetical protein [Cupriavidus necator]
MIEAARHRALVAWILENTPSRMTDGELHRLLTSAFPLVTDPSERGDGRSYFLRRVDWHPSSVTRILRVHFDRLGLPNRIRMCPSSDNNNSVFVQLPLAAPELQILVADEIELFEQRRLARSA